MKIDWKALTEHYHPKEVKWRVGSTNKDKTKGIGLAYVDARTVMDRLDYVVGPENWRDSYHETATNRVICELGIWVGDRWVTKSDGAGATAFEGEKGAISDAFKRAAVKFGIGRYLYELPNEWLPLKNGRLASQPDIKNYVVSKRDTSAYRYGIALQENFESIAAIKSGIESGDLSSAAEAWFELSHETHVALHKAATRGGVFTIEENRMITSKAFREAHFGPDAKNK